MSNIFTKGYFYGIVQNGAAYIVDQSGIRHPLPVSARAISCVVSGDLIAVGADPNQVIVLKLTPSPRVIRSIGVSGGGKLLSATIAGENAVHVTYKDGSSRLYSKSGLPMQQFPPSRR